MSVNVFFSEAAANTVILVFPAAGCSDEPHPLMSTTQTSASKQESFTIGLR
jgi:hypothetical protein